MPKFVWIHFRGETYTCIAKLLTESLVFLRVWALKIDRFIALTFLVGMPQGSHGNPCFIRIQCYSKAFEMKECCRCVSHFHKFSSLLALLKNKYWMWWNCYTAASKSNKYWNFQEKTQKTNEGRNLFLRYSFWNH